MSVIVKGMKMPNVCVKCGFLASLDTEDICCAMVRTVTNRETANWTSRPDWCPLVDVPVPHGNLIDTSQTVEYEYWDEDKEEYVLHSAALSDVLSMALHSKPEIAIQKEDEDPNDGCNGDSCPIYL